MERQKVLIIDDDPSVRECYGKLFRRQGYDPLLEPDGASTERHLEEYRDVRVVILDFRLPGLNGFDLLRQLRSQEFRAGVVLVSGHMSAEMMEQARQLGIRWMFSKPVDTARLLGAVAEILMSGA